MLNGDGNEKGNKINRSNKPKNKLFARAAHFFVHFIAVVFTNAMPFCLVKLPRYTLFFMEELSYVLTKNFGA